MKCCIDQMAGLFRLFGGEKLFHLLHILNGQMVLRGNHAQWGTKSRSLVIRQCFYYSASRKIKRRLTRAPIQQH